MHPLRNAKLLTRKNRWKAFRIFTRSPLTVAGIIIVVFFVFVALFAPVLAPHPDDAYGRATSMADKLKPPSAEHLMGTDDLGRDLLSRVIVGSRLSLGLGLAVVGLTATLGVVLGSIAGFLGGKVDDIIMRIGDILLSIPRLLLAIAVVVATGGGLGKLVLAIAIHWWPWYARVIRAEVLQIREMTYVEAARASGASRQRILLHHVLRNIVSVTVVQASLQIGRAILAVAALGFLGLGVKAPQVEWGLLVSVGRTYMPTWWWVAMFPGAAIFLLGFGFNLMGDGLRDALDPRSSRTR
jgi:peptide/nickel transport system permease protein